MVVVVPVTVPRQLSVVVGTSGVPLHSPTVTSASVGVIGLILSVTVTSWVAVAVKPATFVTVHVTVDCPRGKSVGALLLTLTTEQLSADIGNPRSTFVEVQFPLVVPVTAAGAVIVGLIKSSTVTIILFELLHPLKALVSTNTYIVVINGLTNGLAIVEVNPVGNEVQL